MNRRTFSIRPFLCTLPLLAAAHASEPPAWPYAGDIPSPADASVGLAGAQPTNVARYFKALGAGSGDVSPDGETYIYASSVSGISQVYAVTADGSAPRQLTFGTGVSGFGFSPDGRILITSDTDGNERQGFTLLTADGREETRLLEASDAFNNFGTFDDDGDRFVFSTTRRNGTDFDIYLGTTDGEEREVYQGTFGFFPQAWRPGSDDVLVTETRGEDGAVLHMLDVGTGELTTLFDPEDRSDYQSFVFNPDGSGFWMASNYEREFYALFYVDLGSYEETGDAAAAMTVVHSHDDRDINDVALAGQTLVWTENNGGYSELGAINTRNGREVKLPSLMDGIYSLRASDDDAKLAVTIRGPQTPGTVAVIDLTGRRPKAEIVGYPTDGGLPIEDFKGPEDVRFAAQDGVQLQGLLYQPEDVDGDAPVVIMVHGGPTAQARPSFNPLAQYLLTRGIAVLDLNFRGSTGFGKTFARLDDQMQRTNAVRDVADAVGWIDATEGLDGERVAVMGGSYGGYLTNAAVGSYPDLFRSGISLVGVSDWVRALEEASPGLKASDRIEYGDISDPAVVAFHRSISPINNVGKITAAMMFSHGANDPRDPVTESDNMVQDLRDRGVEVRYLRWPDEGHSVRKLKNRVYLYEEMAAFLESTLTEE